MCRWDDQVGSIEVGKAADLLVIDGRSAPRHREGIPESPYRRLIDATERDVSLVMVGGIAQAGDVEAMASLKPGDFEVVSSQAGCFDKGIGVTVDSAPPYAPYAWNANQDTPFGNPFAAQLFHDRWYNAPCAAR